MTVEPGYNLFAIIMLGALAAAITFALYSLNVTRKLLKGIKGKNDLCSSCRSAYVIYGSDGAYCPRCGHLEGWKA